MTASTDAVFWDMGGVFTASPFHAVAAHASELGLRGEELIEIVFGPYHADTDHAWHRLERGEISLEETMVAIGVDFASRDVEFAPADFFGWMSVTADDDRRVRVVDEIVSLRAEGIRHAMITNNIAEARGRWGKGWGLEDHIEVLIDSSEVGMRKPNPAIYTLAMSRMELDDPARVIFVDDFPSNVEAARSVGMRGVIVQDDDIDTALSELRTMIDS
ncbi:MAG: HAD family phosphatase [Acidobacteria bacterium]|nr:HAD family phosphatase [Acidobacteriota bacterium]